MMNTAIKDQPTNGDVPFQQETILLPSNKAEEFVIEAQKPLTDQEKVQVFSQELSALLQRYGVEMRPYTKMYNSGAQEAAFEFVLLQK